MSESTIRGRIKNFSPKPDENYYGILVDTGKDEVWLNGDNDVPGNLEKGDKVKILADDNGFIDVKNVEVVESSSNSEKSGSSGEGSGERSSNEKVAGPSDGSGDSIRLSKAERIMLQVCFKKAVDTVNEIDESLTQGEHLEKVGELTNGYFNLMLAQAKDKSGGEK